MDKALVLQEVTRRFGDLVAVDHLSLSVDRGQVFGLLGPNGAGKTTAINLVVGLLRRHEGTIQVWGFDPEVEPQQVRQRIGLVPQQTNLYGDLSAVDNLWHHAALYCSDLSAVEQRMADLLRLVELWERRNDPVRTYSGGMQRRLALARALLHDPDIVFFDEPTLGVDVQGRHALWQHIRDQQAVGKTFIISTNNMTEADQLCDRLVIIDHGQAIAFGEPEALKAAMGRDIVLLETTPPIADPLSLYAGLAVQNPSRPRPHQLRLEVAHAEAIVGELVARTTAAHQLQAVSIARPTLDDVFLHHTGRALRD